MPQGKKNWVNPKNFTPKKKGILANKEVSLKEFPGKNSQNLFKVNEK